MLFAFIDEFGSLDKPSTNSNTDTSEGGINNHHPAFGFGGVIIDSTRIDVYLPSFLTAKATLFQSNENTMQDRLSIAERKEIKGSSKLYASRPLKENGELASRSDRKKRFFFLIKALDELQKCGGKVFYHGVIKYDKKNHPFQPKQVYTSFARGTIRRIGKYAKAESKPIVWVFDQHNSHMNWLVQADTNDNKKKTIIRDLQQFMLDEKLNKMSIAPPFQTDSKLSYMLESADWFCALFRHVIRYQLAIFNNSLDTCIPRVGLEYYDSIFQQYAKEMAIPQSVIKLNEYDSLPLDQISQPGFFDGI